MTPVDLLLIEGFKHHPHDKLEVFRRDVGKPLLCVSDARVVAVASDGPVPEARVPVIGLDDTRAIADFILAHCGLARAKARGAA
jgi:molybdopterin-guanine dinucleotide biosynthesis adapter protein